uniref:Alpha/beta hydrolase family, putative n=1 Tax=Theileria annulata TaxID=5874 RepID=A0A3B0MT83_THEAN
MGNRLDSLIFRPPKPPSYSRNDPHLHLIPTPDGNTIASYFVKHKYAKFTIIFSHANAEDIGNVFGNLIKRITKWNCNLFIYDYPGYGLSGGVCSEQNMYNSADLSYNYLINFLSIFNQLIFFNLDVNSKNIIAYGRSLGCSCAIYLGVKYNLLGVILQSPFLSIYRIKLPCFLPFDRFNNYDKVKDLNCPALVIHGDSDDIIPVQHSIQLITRIPEVYYYFVKRGNHNNLDYCFTGVMDSCINEFMHYLLSKYLSETQDGIIFENEPQDKYYGDNLLKQMENTQMEQLLSHKVNVNFYTRGATDINGIEYPERDPARLKFSNCFKF